MIGNLLSSDVNKDYSHKYNDKDQPFKTRITKRSRLGSLWSPYVIGQTIIFLPCDFYLSSSTSFFFSSPNLGGRRLDVYHTSTHGVALVRI